MGQPLIRAGTAADLPAIAAIEADVDWPVANYLDYQLDVAAVADLVVGFLVTRKLVEGEAEILNLAIAQSHRRQGLGRVLLETAFARWPGRWFLEVRESNLGAHTFYINMGFHDVGVRPGYYPTEYGKSPEKGIVMEISK